MSAQLLQGGPLAQTMRAQVAQTVRELAEQGRPVCLAAVQAGERPESLMYVESQRRYCNEVGIDFRLKQLPDAVTQGAVMRAVQELNEDSGVHGIILQLPLPARIDAQAAQRAIDPRKDAEGIHPVNLGLLVYGVLQCAPCTAFACYHLIKSLDQDLYGMEAVVVGHSQIVGKPMGLLLQHDFCTVTTCHVATRDLAMHTRRADILVVAVGKARLITKEMLKPGAIVVDVGINQAPALSKKGKPLLDTEGKPRMRTVGDVDFEGAKEVAGWITPVPGGVGPLTTTMLLRNVAQAAKNLYLQERREHPELSGPLLPFDRGGET
ncbi:MAG: bifunctional 5,10-methylenetetrahydrofolate dehydrogenase/5,10-methenyltetrahydrofolate cyclohydrolase [Planctomycetota bacterium]|nr:bifunctional 5,10-methylenetetrahydrofolate dehydrogenase/5,10-methenyltetrahydrofolate cyclohydrolase [Planctomycetota bacterium]